MAIIVTNPKITINSVDLTGHIDSISIEETFADVDTTTFGQGAKTRLGGLGDHKCTLEFQQDFAVSSVEATIAPLKGLTTQIVVLPINATTTSTNPSYTFTVLVTDWKDLDAKVGEKSMASVTWPISGAVTKATS